MSKQTLRPSTRVAQYPMLSIDFGNSYTKVAIRNSRNDQTTPYRERSLIYDQDKICVPTIAARVVDSTGRADLALRYGGQSTQRLTPRESLPQLEASTLQRRRDPPPAREAQAIYLRGL